MKSLKFNSLGFEPNKTKFRHEPKYKILRGQRDEVVLFQYPKSPLRNPFNCQLTFTYFRAEKCISHRSIFKSYAHSPKIIIIETASHIHRTVMPDFLRPSKSPDFSILNSMNVTKMHFDECDKNAFR